MGLDLAVKPSVGGRINLNRARTNTARAPGAPGAPGVGGRDTPLTRPPTGVIAGPGYVPPGGDWGSPAPGGGTGTGTTPRATYASPPPIDVTTPYDPGQERARTGWEEYSSELEAGTAAETERELQRYRDELSKGLLAEGEAAISRGADPSLFRSRALEGGRRGLLELQGRLADVSLGRRAEALSGMTGAAGAAASERRMMHLGTLAAQQEAQRTLIDQAESQARLQDRPYQRLTDLMGAIGGLLGGSSDFTGLTGTTPGGGGGIGGGGIGRMNPGAWGRTG